MRQAAAAVGADAFVTTRLTATTPTSPSGVDDYPPGNGQLVAFARAFLADPAVFILDEATSSLDIPSERLVQRALRTVLASRTALIIAHLLSRRSPTSAGARTRAGDRRGAAGSDRCGRRYAALHRAWIDSLA